MALTRTRLHWILICGILPLAFFSACASILYERDPYNSIFLSQNLDAKNIHVPAFRVAALVSSDVMMKPNAQSMKVVVFNMKNNKGAPYAFEETFFLQLTPNDRESGLRVDRVHPSQKLYIFKLADSDSGKASALMMKLRAIPEGDQKAALSVMPLLVKCAANPPNESTAADLYFSFSSGVEYSGRVSSISSRSVIRSDACSE